MRTYMSTPEESERRLIQNTLLMFGRFTTRARQLQSDSVTTNEDVLHYLQTSVDEWAEQLRCSRAAIGIGAKTGKVSDTK